MTIAKWRDLYGIPRSPGSRRRHHRRVADQPRLLRHDRHPREGVHPRVPHSRRPRPQDRLQGGGQRQGSRRGSAAVPSPPKSDAMRRSGMTINRYDGSRMMRLRLCGEEDRQRPEQPGCLITTRARSGDMAGPSVPSWRVISCAASGTVTGRSGQVSVSSSWELRRCSDGVVAAAVERNTGCLLRRRMSGRDSRYHYAYGTRRDTASPALDVLRCQHRP